MSGACQSTGAASVSQSAQPYFRQRRDEVPGNVLHPGQGDGLPCSSWRGTFPGSDADGNERIEPAEVRPVSPASPARSGTLPEGRVDGEEVGERSQSKA